VHVLMMALYAAIAATVLATVDPRAETNRQRILHGLRVFGLFVGIGLVLSWIFYPVPW